MGVTALAFCVFSTLLLGAAIFSTVTASREECLVRQRSRATRR